MFILYKMSITLLVVRITSFTFLVGPHYTGNRCSCRHENISGSMSDNRIELEQVVHAHRTSYQSGRLAERPVSCTKSQCSLLKMYFHIRWVPAYARSYSFKTAGGAVSLLNRNSRKVTVLLSI